MAKTVEMPVRLTSSSGQQHSGAFCWREFNTRDRIKRAVIAATICLGIAVAAMPIPLVHLVVPVVMLVSAPIAAIMFYRTAKLPFIIAGKCPNCNQAIQIELERNDSQPPMHKYCPACDQSIRIVKKID